MADKIFWLLTLRLQQIIRCKVLSEDPSKFPGMSWYDLELETPLPRSVYRSLPDDWSNSKMQFCAQSPQPYATTSPFLGSLDGVDQTLLFLSQEQAEEYLKYLRDAGKQTYMLVSIQTDAPERKCRIIKDWVYNNKRKGCWLGEFDPPIISMKDGSEIPFVFFFLKMFPFPKKSILVEFSLLHRDEVDDFTGPRVKKKYIFQEGYLYRPEEQNI